MPYLTNTQVEIIVIVGAILAIIPAAMILRRLGFSPFWAILAPISPLNIIGLWVIAFVRWPVEGHLRS